MAHLHFNRTAYKSGGGKASDLVRYLTRETVEPPASLAARQLRHITRANREDLVYTRSRNLPAWAEGNPHTYFRAAEQYERVNGNAFEEWKVSLPQELTAPQNMALMRDLVEVIAGERLPITYTFHCPTTITKTQDQPHLHLLISGRQNDGVVRGPAQHFKRYNPTNPARGGARKDPALNHYHAVKAWRVTVSDVINLHLERAGHASRIHPDRLDDRGIIRAREPKMWPSESRAYREHGVVTPIVAKVLAIRAQRPATRALEDADAQAYWTARKDTLGLTDGMDRPAQLAVIGAARALVRDVTPVRTVEPSTPDLAALADVWSQVADAALEESQAVWQDAVGEQGLLDAGWDAVAEARLDAAVAWDAVREPAPYDDRATWTDAAQDLQGLVAQLDALAEGGGRGAPVRLWERERGQGQGF